jgi:hypothetical protein
VVTKAAGGHGAVRECVELLLRAQGVWEAIYRAFVEDHGGHVPRGERGGAHARR